MSLVVCLRKEISHTITRNKHRMKRLVVTVLSVSAFVAVFIAVYFFIIPGAASNTIAVSNPSIPTSTASSQATSVKSVSSGTGSATRTVSGTATAVTTATVPTASRTTRAS